MNRNPRVSIFLVIALLLGAIPSYSRTWHVKQDGTGDATSINGAHALAQPGDTILVSPGYYWEPRIYPAFALHLISEAGPEVTTIRLLKMSVDDAHVIIMRNISEPCSVIGFTITGASGGFLDSGGGIDCENSALLIKNNIITGNWCINSGAIWCYGAISPTIEGNLICNNEQWGGGALGITDCSPLVKNNTIVCNNSSDGTSAIWIDGTLSYPIIMNNIIAFDSSSTTGGPAVWASAPASQIVFECNDVWANYPQNYGGTLADLTGVNGNISEDPLFCGVSGTGNYYLQEASPCAESHVPAHCAGLRMGCYPVKCTVGVEHESWGKIKALFKGGEKR
jgi:hypothetical protein